MFGYAGSSWLLRDGGWSSRRTQRRGWRVLAALYKHGGPRTRTTSRIRSTISWISPNLLLHDNVPERISKRVILAVELERGSSLGCAGQLNNRQFRAPFPPQQFDVQLVFCRDQQPDRSPRSSQMLGQESGLAPALALRRAS